MVACVAARAAGRGQVLSGGVACCGHKEGRRVARYEEFFSASAKFPGVTFKGGANLKLYDVKAIARLLDLSERRVRQLKDQNIIQEYKGMPGLYELVSTIHAYVNYLRRRNPESAENIDYNTERAKFMKAKRRDVELDVGIKEGDLHASADIEAVMTSMLTNFKSRLMAIPAKLSAVLSKKTDRAEIHRILKGSVDEALSELADFDNTFNGRAGGNENSNA